MNKVINVLIGNKAIALLALATVLATIANWTYTAPAQLAIAKQPYAAFKGTESWACRYNVGTRVKLSPAKQRACATYNRKVKAYYDQLKALSK